MELPELPEPIMKRWLAIGAGGDLLRLVPVAPPSTGPDVFCKLQDAEEAMRAYAAAAVEAERERWRTYADSAVEIEREWWRGVLADMAFSTDMDLSTLRAKAKRAYEAIRAKA